MIALAGHRCPTCNREHAVDIGEQSVGPVAGLEPEAQRVARLLLRTVYRHELGFITDTAKAIALLRELADIIMRAAVIEDLTARQSLVRELAAMRAAAPTLAPHEFVTMPFDEALAALAKRLTLAPGVILDVANAYQMFALDHLTPQIAREITDIARAQIALGIQQGWTVKQFEERAGAIGDGLIADKYAGAIYRTERTNAHAAGRVAQAFAPELDDWIVAFRYKAVGDRDTRTNHYANDGLMWSKRHPVWEERLPPNGWQCRCRVENISRAEAARLGRIDDAGNFIDDPVPDDGRPDPGFEKSAIRRVYGGR